MSEEKVGNLQKEERNHVIDIIRILAIMLVIMNHVLDSIGHSGICLGNNIIILNMSLYVLCRVGVPLFFMLTGFLLLSKTYDENACKRFYLHNLLPIVLCWVVWVVIYNVFFVVSGYGFVGIIDLLKQILFLEYVPISHEWYMYVIIPIYVLLPFIANALHSISLKYIIIACFFTFVFYFVFNNSNFNVHLNLTYFLYIVLGFLAYKYNNWRKKRKKSYKFAIFWLFCAVLVWVIASLTLWVNFVNAGETVWVWYTSPCLPLIAFSLFLFFLECFTVIDRKGLFKRLSNMCFGVYLLHNIFIITFPKVFHFSNIISFVTIEFLSVTLISFLIVWLVSFIPYVRKILFRLK